eukprot:6465025-Amphidinium_carterae.5
MKDLMTADDLVTTSDEQAAIVQKRNKRCKHVVRMIAGEEVEKEESKVAKLFRRKALQVMAGIDHILRGCFQSTLSRFVVDAELRGGSARDWPGLNLICDQGPDNMAAVAFMHHVGCNVHVVFDPNHRCWNDARAALTASGGGGTVVSSTVVLNWGSAPFGSAGFHATAQEAARRLIENHTIEPNPIIEYFTDAIVAEKGLSHMYADVELERVVAAAVAETYRKKQGKIGMCRWFEWYEGASELLSSWSCRLVVLLFVALVHKEVVVSEQLQKRWRVRCATLTSDDADDTTTAEAKQQGPDEKEAPADLLSIALAFLLDDANKWKVWT